MLTIRLQRTGKRNRPTFRIVVAEKESHVSKKITEVLGSYDPRTKQFTINEDRVKYWLGLHTNLSATMHNMLVGKGLLGEKKVKAFSTPKKEQPAAAPAAPAAPAAEAAPESAPAPAEEVQPAAQ